MAGMKNRECTCKTCGAKWIGSAADGCPNGCSTVVKSGDEYTKKTLQGDNDLMKGLR